MILFGRALSDRFIKIMADKPRRKMMIYTFLDAFITKTKLQALISAQKRDKLPGLRQKIMSPPRPYLLQNRVLKERITPKNTAFFF